MHNFEFTYYLTRIEGLGPVRIKYLLDHFGSPDKIFKSNIKELCEIENINEKTAQTIINSSAYINTWESDLRTLKDKVSSKKLGILTYSDSNYPENLKKIYDPPVILYYRGNYLNENLRNSLAIVGTRTPTDYGRDCTEKFAYELSSAGLAIVSGFARGIDTIAHKTVISINNNKAYTCGVLGCGVDVIYPPENKKLYEQLIEKGLILSEYEPGTEPDKINFPKRNRIISGLSLGTLIIESGVDGGAMITARSALDQYREVFAIPGRINSKQSSGTNWLIKNSHAKLVDSIDDIITEIKSNLIDLKIKTNGSIIPADLKGAEEVIYNSLITKNEAVHIDSISDESGLNISELLVNLLNLEFKGYVEQLPGKRFKAKIR